MTLDKLLYFSVLSFPFLFVVNGPHPKMLRTSSWLCMLCAYSWLCANGLFWWWSVDSIGLLESTQVTSMQEKHPIRPSISSSIKKKKNLHKLRSELIRKKSLEKRQSPITFLIDINLFSINVNIITDFSAILSTYLTHHAFFLPI